MIQYHVEIVRRYRAECDACRTHLGLDWSAEPRDALDRAVAAGLEVVPRAFWRDQWVAHLCRACLAEWEKTRPAPLEAPPQP